MTEHRRHAAQQNPPMRVRQPFGRRWLSLRLRQVKRTYDPRTSSTSTKTSRRHSRTSISTVAYADVPAGSVSRRVSQHLLTAGRGWRDSLEVSPARPTARQCNEAQKASGGKACQFRKTLTAEAGTAWRPERLVGIRLSRAQDAFDCVAIPRHSWSADGQWNCIFIHRRQGRELTVLPR